MEYKRLKFINFFWKVTSSHMITYFLIGLIASVLLDYKEAFENPPMSFFMRPLNSPWVAIGPVLQVFRGLIFSIVLWFFKDIFLSKDYGWLKLWGLIVGLSILSTTGPAPGSIEGMIYTKIPIIDQLKGYLEVIPQTLLFSILLYYWSLKPNRAWNIISIILVAIIIILCTMGLLIST
ncbi:MAG: hypothetical protein JXB00_13750 [Bacteroidales bacterium]|nr:hypothetical protein [Bacteroidales bacterium]